MSNMASASDAARDALLQLDAAQLLMGHVAVTQSGAAQVNLLALLCLVLDRAAQERSAGALCHCCGACAGAWLVTGLIV